MMSTSILDLSENDLIARLLRPDWRYRIVEIAGMPSVPVDFKGVPLCGVPHKENRGDIDILLCNPNEPQHAVAIEVKRVKFNSAALETLRPNKIHELTKGAKQANRLARIGFSQVYFFPFFVVDTRERNAGQYTFDGTTPGAKDYIRDAMAPVLSALLPAVGAYRCEFTQPMDYEPLSVGGFLGHLHRLATTVEQSPELTRWVLRVVNEESAEAEMLTTGLRELAQSKTQNL